MSKVPTWLKSTLKIQPSKVVVTILLIIVCEFGRIQGAIIGDIMQIDPRYAENALYQILSRFFYPHFWELTVLISLPVLPFAWLVSQLPFYPYFGWFSWVLIYSYFYFLSCLLVRAYGWVKARYFGQSN